MKTTPDFSVLARLLPGLLTMPFAPALRGDTWSQPGVVIVSSPSSNYIVRVAPGSEVYNGYESAITNREANASVIVGTRRDSGVTNVVWIGKLINPSAPVEVYLSDAGYLVTMDNWHNVGYGPVVAIYDPKGRLLRHWSLEELFQPEERHRFSQSISSIHWHAGQAHFGEGHETNVFVVPAVGKSLRFDLTSGTLLESSATRTNTLAPDATGHGQ
jgi:hypothetical protein